MAPFSCAFQGNFFVCIPTTVQVKAIVRQAQIAADAMINQLPFFITWTDAAGKPAVFKTSPIGTSKSGYDGKVGPFTAGMVQLALIGAIEMWNQTGALGRVPPEILSAAKETDEQLRVQKIAFNASSIAGFLAETVGSFDAMLAEVRERAQQGTLKPPILTQEVPVDRGIGLQVPPSLVSSTKSGKRRFAMGPWASVGLALSTIGIGAAGWHFATRE